MPQTRSEILTLQGNPFHVYHWGDPSKPKLLLLHGFPEHGGAWADLAHHLSDTYHCIAPDQRGYGQSWAPEGISYYTTSALVADMVALIGDVPLTVIGHDWGAAVAYGLAMSYPDLVDKLIIMNGVHPVPFQRAMAAGGDQTKASQYIHFLRNAGSEDALAAEDFAKLQGFFAANMDMSWLTGDVLADYKRAWGDSDRLRTMINWYRASPLKVAYPDQPIVDLPEFPAKKLMVRCPHLLIWGEEDTALMPSSHEGLEAFAPDLTRINVPGADHWLHHQKPAEVAQIIKDWLA